MSHIKKKNAQEFPKPACVGGGSQLRSHMKGYVFNIGGTAEDLIRGLPCGSGIFIIIVFNVFSKNAISTQDHRYSSRLFFSP